MPKDLKLYYSRNLNPRVAVAVAKYLDSPVEYIPASPQHPNHEEAFRPLNPNRLVPVLVEDGRSLWEVDAIACRLSAIAGSDFWPTDARMPELVQWVGWANNHLTPAGATFYFHRLIRPQFSDVEPHPSLLEDNMARFRQCAAILDMVLAGRDWLVGGHFSYADLRVATVFPFAESAGLPYREYRNIFRWHERLSALEAWGEPFGSLAEHPDQIKPLGGPDA